MAINSILAFDFGLKSIGVAVGQKVTGTASPLHALKAQDGAPDWQKVAALIDEWQPDALVVGLPLNMDGTEQAITARVTRFCNRLHGRFGLDVLQQDERLTTVDAKATLFELGGFKKLEKGKIDSASACVIAESWLSTNP